MCLECVPPSVLRRRRLSPCRSIASCQIGPTQMACIAEALQGNKTLTQLM